MGNVDSTNDKLTRGNGVDAQAHGLTASPRITPISVEKRSNRRYLRGLRHPFVFRDFVADVEDVSRRWPSSSATRASSSAAIVNGTA
jgi:hypothetical protein